MPGATQARYRGETTALVRGADRGIGANPRNGVRRGTETTHRADPKIDLLRANGANPGREAAHEKGLLSHPTIQMILYVGAGCQTWNARNDHPT